MTAPRKSRAKPPIHEPHPDKPGWFRVPWVARLWDLSVRRVSELVNEGVIQRPEDGYLPFAEVNQAYIKHLRKRAAGRPQERTPDGDALVSERHRKLKLENDLTSGELVPTTDVMAVLNELATMLANQLDGAAGRIASGDSVLRQRLLNEHRRIRDALADGLEAYAATIPSGEPGAPAPESDPVAVGRE